MNQTKEKILNAALELFSQKGFSAVSIRDICALVQIKESTIYYHVQNKEAILDALLEEFQNLIHGFLKLPWSVLIVSLKMQ